MQSKQRNGAKMQQRWYENAAALVQGHLAMIAEQGRLAWQVATGYGQRSLIETTMGRYKALIGPRLRARGFATQQTEAAIGVAGLDPVFGARPPGSGRRQPGIR